MCQTLALAASEAAATARAAISEASFLVCNSARGGEVRVERLAYRHRFLAGKATAGRELGDRFEVVVLSTRQAPVEHACCRVPDVLETVHHIARDEDNGAGSGRRGLIADGQLISTL